MEGRVHAPPIRTLYERWVVQIKLTVTKHEHLTKLVIAGVTGGLMGGTFFGLILAFLGMLPRIAQLIGDNSANTGLVVHMLISAVFGGLFGLVFASRIKGFRSAVGLGLGYGVFWWVLGALVLMPLLLGMPPQLGSALSSMNLLSLLGHLVYGVATSATIMAMTQPTFLS
jgi:hypothetical protein